MRKNSPRRLSSCAFGLPGPPHPPHVLASQPFLVQFGWVPGPASPRVVLPGTLVELVLPALPGSCPGPLTFGADRLLRSGPWLALLGRLCSCGLCCRYGLREDGALGSQTLGCVLLFALPGPSLPPPPAREASPRSRTSPSPRSPRCPRAARGLSLGLR